MLLEKKTVGDVLVVAVGGELTPSSTAEFAAQIERLVDAGHSRLVLNLSQLEYINSTALGFLVKLSKRLREARSDLVISRPSKFFETTVRTLGLDSIFTILDTDEDAVRYLSGGATTPRRPPVSIPIKSPLARATTSLPQLEILIDPGSAPPEEIGALLADISKLYRMVGGSGISWTIQGVRCPEPELVP